MIDNNLLIKEIASELKYLPNQKENSYYKVYKNVNLRHQIRVSTHGTYLRTWIDKNYDPSISTNISIAFTTNGVPTNDCIIDSQTNAPFTDCNPCINQQSISQKPCKPRQVAGISNKKRQFSVKQFIYNCQEINLNDIPILVKAIKQAAGSGEYIDPFANIPSKAAKSIELTPGEPVKESTTIRKNIFNKNYLLNCNRIMKTNKKVVRFTESKLRNIITETIKTVLKEVGNTKDVEKIPTWALNYLINGTTDNLSREEIEEINIWRRKARIYNVAVPNGEPYFCRYPAFGEPTDVYDCMCLYNN